MFEPDSALAGCIHASPNVEERRSELEPDMLVLHYTGLASIERALDVLSRPDCKVSCHYLIGLDGTIIQMVPERLRAWHAGVAIWEGVTDINSCSIGVEIHNIGHAAGYPDFPEPQMRAVESLCRDICRRRGIRPERVLAHSDVAPLRKCDPGEKLDWRRLHAVGIGHWVEPAPVDPDDGGLRPGDEGAAVAQMQALLADYGYGIVADGIFDARFEAVLRAFQRHFRPSRVDGRIDGSTRATLERLLATRPSMIAA
jgi:N-acetylmuramoyl-L-alanine amidase